MNKLKKKTFVNKVLKCDDSNDCYIASLACCTVCHAVKRDSNFCMSLWMKSSSVTIQVKSTGLCLPVGLFVCWC